MAQVQLPSNYGAQPQIPNPMANYQRRIENKEAQRAEQREIEAAGRDEEDRQRQIVKDILIAGEDFIKSGDYEGMKSISAELAPDSPPMSEQTFMSIHEAWKTANPVDEEGYSTTTNEGINPKTGKKGIYLTHESKPVKWLDVGVAPEEDKEASSTLEKETEYLAGLMGMEDDEKKAELAMRLKSKAGTGQDISPTRAQMTQQHELLQEYDTISKNLEEMIATIEDDPSLIGIIGSIRKGAQTATGIAEDFAQLVGDMPILNEILNTIGSVASEEMTPEQAKSFADDPNLSKLRLFENNLGFALARSRQPRGRLLKDTIDRSMADAQLTGMKSSRDVIYRMHEILRLIKENQRNVVEVMKGDTGQRRRVYVPGQGLQDAPDD